MADARNDDAAASAGSASELPGYRPVSSLAVAAAAVGCAGALALVSPVFWVVPLIGTILSVVAIRDVGRSGVAKAGGLAAIIGLALSLGFGVQAAAATVTARWLAAARAEATAAYWLETVCAGRLHDARSMCGPEAAVQIDTAAACCGAEPARIRCLGRGETAASWVLQVSRGPCAFDLVVEPAVDTTGGRVVERWLVRSLTPAGGVQ